jgi:hypothetical protein
MVFLLFGCGVNFTREIFSLESKLTGRKRVAEY